MSTNHDLYEALQNWFTAALDYLGRTHPPVRSLRRLQWDTNGLLQIRTGGGFEPRIWLWIEQHRSRLSHLPETDAVLDAALSHSPEEYPESVQYKITKASLGNPEYIFAQILFPLLAEHLYSHGLQLPAYNDTEKMAAQIIDFLQQPVMLFTPSAVVLVGIRAPQDFQLEDGIVFRATTLLEQKRYYFGEDPTLPDVDIPEEGRGYAPTHVLDIAQSLMPHAQEIAESFILACRLLDMDTVGYRYIEQRPDNPVRRGGASRVPPFVGRAVDDSPIELTESQIRTLQRLWKRYRLINTDSNTRILVDRFGWSFQRPTFEDQIIDLWIAIESIFAPESYTGELQYRMALRVSRLLHSDPKERQEVFSRLKKAYGSRSKVVHGTSITKAKDWEEVTEHTRFLRHVVKTVLQKMVDEGWQPHYPEMDFRDGL